jgi:hypothetical protein
MSDDNTSNAMAWYRSPVFIMLLTSFITGVVHILVVTAPKIAAEIEQIGVPTLVDTIGAGLGLIATIAAGIGAWYRAKSKIAPLTVTKAQANVANNGTTVSSTVPQSTETKS